MSLLARRPSRRNPIDTAFDFRRDTPAGKDPDAASPTLRSYHRLLWSKPLPSGALFDLSASTPKVYLHHRSALGEFSLSSDTVVPSFRKEPSLAPIIGRIPRRQWNHFLGTIHTMGGMMLFPSNRVDKKVTINGARGMHPRIKDRFDLTVECIRRHYLAQASPLSDTLQRYSRFFELFESFQGYVEFFLLQDLLSPDYTEVKFFLPFKGFVSSPLPKSLAAYRDYRQFALGFVAARNRRILGDLARRPRV